MVLAATQRDWPCRRSVRYVRTTARGIEVQRHVSRRSQPATSHAVLYRE
jgi:hypothetical protein